MSETKAKYASDITQEVQRAINAKLRASEPITREDVVALYNEITRLSMWLDDIAGFAFDRDGEVSAEGLGKLVDDIYGMARKALAGEKPDSFADFEVING